MQERLVTTPHSPHCDSLECLSVLTSGHLILIDGAGAHRFCDGDCLVRGYIVPNSLLWRAGANRPARELEFMTRRSEEAEW